MGRLIKERSLTFTRYGAQQIDANNNYVSSADSEIKVKGNLQPLNYVQAQRILPEGRVSNYVYKLYTKTKLLSADTNTGVKADTTVIDGVTFEVFHGGNNTTADVSRKLDHYVVILVEVERNGVIPDINELPTDVTFNESDLWS